MCFVQRSSPALWGWSSALLLLQHGPGELRAPLPEVPASTTTPAPQPDYNHDWCAVTTAMAETAKAKQSHKTRNAVAGPAAQGAQRRQQGGRGWATSHGGSPVSLPSPWERAVPVSAPPLRAPSTMVPRGAVTARWQHGPFKSGAAMICLVLGLFAGLFHSGMERDGTPGPGS